MDYSSSSDESSSDGGDDGNRNRNVNLNRNNGNSSSSSSSSSSSGSSNSSSSSSGSGSSSSGSRSSSSSDDDDQNRNRNVVLRNRRVCQKFSYCGDKAYYNPYDYFKRGTGYQCLVTGIGIGQNRGNDLPYYTVQGRRYLQEHYGMGNGVSSADFLIRNINNEGMLTGFIYNSLTLRQRRDINTVAKRYNTLINYLRQRGGRGGICKVYR